MGRARRRKLLKKSIRKVTKDDLLIKQGQDAMIGIFREEKYT